jgi:hypothetical protein
MYGKCFTKLEEKPGDNTNNQTGNTNTTQVSEKPKERKEKDYSAQVKELIDMGFPKAESEAAIKAARGDVSIACEFLYNGIPENLPAEDEGEEGEGGAISESTLLKGIASVVKIICHNNPSQLQSITMSLQQSSPELFEIIRQNENEFKVLIQQPITEEDVAAFQQFTQQGGQLGGSQGGSGQTGSPQVAGVILVCNLVVRWK